MMMMMMMIWMIKEERKLYSYHDIDWIPDEILSSNNEFMFNVNQKFNVISIIEPEFFLFLLSLLTRIETPNKQ